MATLIDSIPESDVKKIGISFFNEHKGKVESVVKATKASGKELRDPETLKELFGLPDSGSIGSKKVDLSAFKKKLSLTITLVEYNKLIDQLNKTNAWFAKVAAFNPEPEIKKRKKKAEKLYQAYAKAAIKDGKDDKKAIKLGEAALKELGPLATDLSDLAGYYTAGAAVYPRHQKVFAAYAKTFGAARDMFDRVLSTIPLEQSYQAELMGHYQACLKLRSLCNDADKHCLKIAKDAKSKSKLVDGYRIMLRAWFSHIGESVLPAKVKAAAKSAEQAIKPATDLLKKLMGG